MAKETMISVRPTRFALALLHFEIFVGRRPGNSNVKSELVEAELVEGTG